VNQAVAEALMEELTLLRTLTLCVPALEGGVYRPELEMMPRAEFPPSTPSTDQVTVGSVRQLWDRH
jgi:hypothetical protein